MIRMWRESDETRAAIAEGRIPKIHTPYPEMTLAQRARDLGPITAEMRARVAAATTWSVAKDMVTLVTHAAARMPAETVERSDLPCPNGFALLEDPMFMGNEEGSVRIPFRALQWASDDTSAEVIAYRSRHDLAVDEEDVSREDQLSMPPLWPSHLTEWRFGQPSWAPDDQPAQAVAFLKALWTISAQPISVVATAPPGRAERRRAERIGLPDEGGVRVITLRRQRRELATDEEEGAVAWSHRWIVGGHWRNQYLPSTGGHRLQWIPDHVKGPADKPLVIKPTVFDVRR